MPVGGGIFYAELLILVDPNYKGDKSLSTLHLIKDSGCHQQYNKHGYFKTMYVCTHMTSKKSIQADADMLTAALTQPDTTMVALFYFLTTL